MYLPPHFTITDRALLHDVIRRWSFGTLVTIHDGVPVAGHLPFVLDAERGPHGTLVAHMARANNQWRSFADAEVLAMFQAEHAYVSPSWYEPQAAVPTWNYIAVHAYGVPRILDTDATIAHLHTLVEQHEGGFDAPWQLDESYARKLRNGVVAFEIPIARLEGKWKLSQNRSDADRAGVIAALTSSADPLARALAAQMQEHP